MFVIIFSQFPYNLPRPVFKSHRKRVPLFLELSSSAGLLLRPSSASLCHRGWQRGVLPLPVAACRRGACETLRSWLLCPALSLTPYFGWHRTADGKQCLCLSLQGTGLGSPRNWGKHTAFLAVSPTRVRVYYSWWAYVGTPSFRAHTWSWGSLLVLCVL